eukprot:TRINITY_DN948_c0_g1_i4.p1 TRINITY_DN948_c0_g1~~TRINITY_DN948_c0_g1_i4.p1  ORF type:complete len:108 (-),score=16.11 TRINITY_DN948_c0_g1_i4:58-381(-)
MLWDGRPIRSIEDLDNFIKMEHTEEDASPPDQSRGMKPRKQYTITKQRENWTDEEHAKFLEALKVYDRDWKKIEKFIGTKSVIQRAIDLEIPLLLALLYLLFYIGRY